MFEAVVDDVIALSGPAHTLSSVLCTLFSSVLLLLTTKIEHLCGRASLTAASWESNLPCFPENKT